MTSQNHELLTLKGQITLEFVDGKTLEATLIAQDPFNIFVTIDDTPHMIPRVQLRFIKGHPEQKIEPDTSAVQPSSPILTKPDIDDSDDREDDTLQLEETDETDETVELPDEAVAQTDSASDTIPPDLFGIDFSDEPYPEPEAPPLAEEEEDSTMILEPGEAEPSSESLPPDEEDATFVLPESDVGAETHEIAAYLDCITGPHAGEVFKLTPGITTVGRATDNILALSKDKEISRRHSKFTYEGGQFLIEDQGSLNGTFVNNERIDNPRYLEEGDVVMVGVSTLIYHKK